MPAATSAPNASTRMISVIGSESSSGLAEVVAVRGLDALLGARVAELADREARMGALARRRPRQGRLDLVDRLVLVAADAEVDERGVAVLRDRAAMDVLHGCDAGDARDDVARPRR